MKQKNILLIVLAGFGITLGIVSSTVHRKDVTEQKADLVIFSYNRPLQLFALLESVEKYITGLGEIHVIYRAGDENYARAYDEVCKAFSTAQFSKQGGNPAGDFKPLTLKATFDSPSKYVLFAVDDIVVKDHINISKCIVALEKTGAYGFYLRLGKNLSECYPLRCKQSVPPLIDVEQELFSWKFSEGSCDWAYPHTVDMTLYRKQDAKIDFQAMQYHSPNVLEGRWHGRSGKIMSRCGLCYQQSKVVNMPLNRVQSDINNRHMRTLPPIQLLKIFNENKKMDINPLFCINNKAAHMEYEPIYIER